MVIGMLMNDADISYKLQKHIESIQLPQKEIETDFLTLKEQFNRAWIVSAYSMILKDQNVYVIDSQNLKKIIINHSYDFQKIYHENAENYKKLLNVKNLVILKIGYEDKQNKLDYFLDFLREFLEYRNHNDLITLSFSDLTIAEIQQKIFENSQYRNTEVNKRKLLSCFSSLQNRFS